MNQEVTFEAFYKKYYSDITSYCCSQYKIDRHNAEDIVEEAFIVLWQQWSSFDTRTEMGLFVWIRRTVRNLSLTFIRNNARGPVLISLEQWAALEEPQYDSTIAYIIQEEQDNELLYNKYLDSIKTRLTKREWQLFECVIVNHNSIKNTARILEMKENTVKVSLKRLRSKLQKNVLPKVLK